MAFCNTFNNQNERKKNINPNNKSAKEQQINTEEKNRHYSFTFALFIATFEFNTLYDEWKICMATYLQPRLIRCAHVRHGDIAIVLY